MSGWQAGILFPLVVALLVAAGGGAWVAGKNHRETRRRLIAAAEKMEQLECLTHAQQFKDMQVHVMDMREEGQKRKHENGLIIKSLYAICDGLIQQGCNGMVSQTHNELRNHIIDER